MSDNVDALLGGEDDVGDYDLRDEDEDALLEDDGYEQSREINSVQEDQYQYDESGDVLELSAEELLNEDDENDYNDSIVEETPRDKFNRERTEMPSSSIVPDTTTKITRKPMGAYKRGNAFNNRGRFQHRGAMRGSFRGGGDVRGRGSPRGYQNVQNRNVRQRSEAWVKKPMQVQPWINRPPAPVPYQQPRPQPLLQAPKPWVSDVQEDNNYYNTPPQVKPSVHQRLGYNQQPMQQQQIPQYQQQPAQQFFQPPPMQMQPAQQIPFEQERIIVSHPVQLNPPQGYNQPQQYQQPPPIFNQPPPNQYGNQNMMQPMPNNYQNNYIPPLLPQQQQQQQHYPPQYNPDPYIQPQQMPPQPQQVICHNEPGYFEPPPRIDDYTVNVQNEGYNDGYEYNAPYNANQPPQQQQYNQPRIIRTNSFSSPPSPQKRRMEFRKPYVEKESVQNKMRKVFENKNLHEVKTVESFDEVEPAPTSTYTISSRPIPDDEDDETRKYRLQIEKQKRLREQLLARKEERRKLAAQKQQVEEAMKTIPSPKELIKPPPPVPNVPTVNRTLLNKPQKAPLVNTALRAVNANPPNNADSIKAFLSNRKIIAKDESLLETSIVVVSNLAAGTSEVKLRKISSGVGEIQKFELSPKERQATIQFNSVASAHAFYKKYQRFMLDLSMIKVTLKPYS